MRYAAALRVLLIDVQCGYFRGTLGFEATIDLSCKNNSSRRRALHPMSMLGYEPASPRLDATI